MTDQKVLERGNPVFRIEPPLNVSLNNLLRQNTLAVEPNSAFHCHYFLGRYLTPLAFNIIVVLACTISTLNVILLGITFASWNFKLVCLITITVIPFIILILWLKTNTVDHLKQNFDLAFSSKVITSVKKKSKNWNRFFKKSRKLNRIEADLNVLLVPQNQPLLCHSIRTNSNFLRVKLHQFGVVKLGWGMQLVTILYLIFFEAANNDLIITLVIHMVFGLSLMTAILYWLKPYEVDMFNFWILAFMRTSWAKNEK